jgi:hypothetical protein
VMRKRDQKMLEKALATIRDPDVTGRTRVSAGFTGQPMKCLLCKLPKVEQEADVVVPPGPRCDCLKKCGDRWGSRTCTKPPMHPIRELHSDGETTW